MRRLLFALALPIVTLTTLAAGCASTEPAPAAGPTVGMEIDPASADTAVFAGGCFWCMEKPFEELEGVASVVSGFSGGTTPNPTYDQVANKRTDHYEVVEVIYDPSVVSYDTLLQVYWHNVDPLDGDGQFCDRGTPYRPAIFVSTASERASAERTKSFLDGRFSAPIAVEVLGASPFYAAEDYHQDYYRKRTRPIISATAPDAVATRAWKSSGAITPGTSAPRSSRRPRGRLPSTETMNSLTTETKSLLSATAAAVIALVVVLGYLFHAPTPPRPPTSRTPPPFPTPHQKSTCLILLSRTA